jgi:hypothetical protein
VENHKRFKCRPPNKLDGGFTVWSAPHFIRKCGARLLVLQNLFEDKQALRVKNYRRETTEYPRRYERTGDLPFGMLTRAHYEAIPPLDCRAGQVGHDRGLGKDKDSSRRTALEPDGQHMRLINCLVKAYAHYEVYLGQASGKLRFGRLPFKKLLVRVDRVHYPGKKLKWV